MTTKRKSILYITDNFLYVYSRKLNQNFKINIPNNIVKNGRIIDCYKFVKVFENIQSKLKISNSFLGENIIIICCNNYNIDYEILKYLFNYLGYKNIQIENELHFLKFKKNNAWINIQANYLIIAYIDRYNKIQNIFTK